MHVNARMHGDERVHVEERGRRRGNKMEINNSLDLCGNGLLSYGLLGFGQESI